jgi:hypothetical protein
VRPFYIKGLLFLVLPFFVLIVPAMVLGIVTLWNRCKPVATPSSPTSTSSQSAIELQEAAKEVELKKQMEETKVAYGAELAAKIAAHQARNKVTVTNTQRRPDWMQTRPNWEKTRDAYIASVLTTIFLLYPSICRQVFFMFSCQALTDVSVQYLIADQSQVIIGHHHLPILQHTSNMFVCVFCVAMLDH